MSVGEMSVGEMSVGEVSVGEMSVGEMSWIQVPEGSLFMNIMGTASQMINVLFTHVGL